MPVESVDLVEQHHRVELAVRRIVELVYRAAGEESQSHQEETLILARVSARLVEALVIQLQTDVLKSHFLATTGDGSG